MEALCIISKTHDVSYDLLLDRMEVMDTESAIPVTGNGVEFENFVPRQLPISPRVNGTPNGSCEIEGLGENLEDAVKLNDGEAFSSVRGNTDKPEVGVL